VNALRSWFARLGGLFNKERRERELAEEIEAHLQMHLEDNVDAGMTPEEARRQALIEFGGIEQTKEDYRSRVGIPQLEIVIRDVHFGLRMLRKKAGLSIVAVITLALGIGVNTAIFSVVDSMLLRPLPVRNPSQIVLITPQQRQGVFSIHEYLEIEKQTPDILSGLIGYEDWLDGVTVNGQTDRSMNSYVTGNFFSVLGIEPSLGRVFLPSEGRVAMADPVMVLSYSCWQSRFHRDPRIIGTKISVDGHEVRIVGVAPQGFYGVNSWVNVQGYLPIGMAPITGDVPDNFDANRTYRGLTVFGRVRDGTTLREAESALGIAARQLSQEDPRNEENLTVSAFPELTTRLGAPGTAVRVSGLFLGLAALVLILACLNIANLFLVCAATRSREMALRAALGAGRGRLVCQIFTESILLATAGGMLGIVLGWCGGAFLSSVNLQTDIPLRLEFSFDWRVLSYALVAVMATALLVGIVPALYVSRGGLGPLLNESGRYKMHGWRRFRNAFMAAQVGGSLMVLITAGLFIRSLTMAQRANLGFDPDHVLNLTMDPLLTGYSKVQGTAFYKNLLDRVRALPGIVSASTAFLVPMGYATIGDTVTIDGDPREAAQQDSPSSYNVVSPGYFDNMRVAIIRGRAFTEADDERAQHVAIVSESFARRYWPRVDPMGQRFKMAGDPQHFFRVVGVVADVRYKGVTGSIDPYFYVPFAQRPWDDSWETLQVRTVHYPESMIPAIKREVESFAAGQPIWDVETMNEGLYTLPGLLPFQVSADLAAGLGVLGLILAVVGVYGVVSYDANQRTHEIAVRVALGAQPRAILRTIIRQGMLVVAVGLVAGLAGAFAMARLLEQFLIVSATDLATYLAVPTTLALVALVACWIPARRALSIEPAMALRHE
jgi:predicted permease